MLKKRIYLPENCKKEDCPIYMALVKKCKSCHIFKADKKERETKNRDAHNKASLKYYHKNKTIHTKGV